MSKLFLDAPFIRPILVILIWLYIFGLFPGINQDIAELISNPLLAILALIAIIRLSYEDLYLAIILGVALIMSIHMSQFKIFGPRTNLYGNKEWSDPTFMQGVMGHNVDVDCTNNWTSQCQGVNDFVGRTGYDTQGMNGTQGRGSTQEYVMSNF
jgi:hypothetical protein